MSAVELCRTAALGGPDRAVRPLRAPPHLLPLLPQPALPQVPVLGPRRLARRPGAASCWTRSTSTSSSRSPPRSRRSPCRTAAGSTTCSSAPPPAPCARSPPTPGTSAPPSAGLSVLHTWGSNLSYHPAPALRRPRRRPRPRGRPLDRLPARPSSCPSRVLSRRFRTLFLDGLEARLPPQPPALRRLPRPALRSPGLPAPSPPPAPQRVGRVRQAPLRRARPRARLPRPLHAPRRHLQRPHPGRRERQGPLPMEGLPPPAPLEDHDALRRGVHPQIPAARPAPALPPHPPFRAAGRTPPQAEPRPVPAPAAHAPALRAGRAVPRTTRTPPTPSGPAPPARPAPWWSSNASSPATPRPRTTLREHAAHHPHRSSAAPRPRHPCAPPAPSRARSRSPSAPSTAYPAAPALPPHRVRPVRTAPQLPRCAARTLRNPCIRHSGTSQPAVSPNRFFASQRGPASGGHTPAARLPR